MTTDIAPKSKEELKLEKAVFGDAEGFESELFKIGKDGVLNVSDSESEGADEADDAEDGSEDELFYIDKGSNASDGSDNDDDSDMSDSDDEEDVQVWHDSDDDELEVNLTSSHRTKKLRKAMSEDRVSGKDYEKRLRAHFEKLMPRPAWAALERIANSSSGSKEGSDEEDSDVEIADDDDDTPITANPLKELLAKKTNYISQTKTKLLPTSDLDIQRLADVTKQMQSQAVVQCVDFHPTQPLVLTAGFDRTLRIYQIDGKTNPVATSLYIENCPFRTAVFHPDGKRVIAAGRRRYMFIWDLETGSVEKVSRLYGHEHTQSSFEKFVVSPDGEYIALVGDNGWMNLLSAYTGQWLAGAKIEGDIIDMAWTEPEHVTLVNSSGDVWIWDAQSRQMKSRWRDPSLVGVVSVAQSTNWIAIGMDNGIVCVYSRTNPRKAMRLSSSEPETREADRIVENLITTISSMEFSPDGQMLVIASKLKRDALRVVHVPSFSVFKNWPTSSTPLGHVSSLAWSPQNQMLAAGNEGGYVRLWALNHYS